MYANGFGTRGLNEAAIVSSRDVMGAAVGGVASALVRGVRIDVVIRSVIITHFPIRGSSKGTTLVFKVDEILVAVYAVVAAIICVSSAN